MATFMDGVQLPQGYRATNYEEEVYFLQLKFPETLGTHLIDLQRMKG